MIFVSGNIRNKANIELQVGKLREITKKEIDDLKQPVNELEKFSQKGIEKRLQTIETIVVDDDYHLTMKFKKLLEDNSNSIY